MRQSINSGGTFARVINVESSVSACTTAPNRCSVTKQWRETHVSSLATPSPPFYLHITQVYLITFFIPFLIYTLSVSNNFHCISSDTEL